MNILSGCGNGFGCKGNAVELVRRVRVNDPLLLRLDDTDAELSLLLTLEDLILSTTFSIDGIDFKTFWPSCLMKVVAMARLSFASLWDLRSTLAFEKAENLVAKVIFM